ncbi:unnamed protein product [Lactuca virosa]|uniref:Uncharacterized protein n=1 Tax=Lactuca virosa TaxID=75947 RepID=A0AAU9MHD5_9ASTR|nr:unnamed protein product [Lactuca virosa]
MCTKLQDDVEHRRGADKEIGAEMGSARTSVTKTKGCGITRDGLVLFGERYGSWNAKWMIQRIKCSKCLYLGIDDERQDVFTTVNGLQKLKHNDLSKS